MKKFDLERLRGKKVAVHCVTKEEFQDFVEWAASLGVDEECIKCWDYYNENSCCVLKEDLRWGYGSKNFYNERGYEIISFEEALISQNEHYKRQGIDTIKRCKANMTLEQQKAICIFNIDRYLYREKGQNLSDIKKIRDYLDWLEELENEI